MKGVETPSIVYCILFFFVPFFNIYFYVTFCDVFFSPPPQLCAQPILFICFFLPYKPSGPGVTERPGQNHEISTYLHYYK